MRLITQTILVPDHVEAGTADDHVESGEAAGNCLQACVASILELDLGDVPHFVQYVDHPAGTEPTLWRLALIGFCALRDWDVWVSESPPEGRSIVLGKSERGHNHACVGWNGNVVHDPHPSRAGLDQVSYFLAFNKRDWRERVGRHE